MNPSTPTHSKAPKHVPPHLIREFDFRHGLGERPHDVIARLHQGPPVFYSPVQQAGFPGHWIIVKAEHIRRILQDPETFSSQNMSGRQSSIGARQIPVDTDPPEHGKYRALMNPIFSPTRMKVMDEKIRQRAIDFIEPLAAHGACDFVVDYAQKFPAAIFVDLMGLPAEEVPQFLAWEHHLVGGEAEHRMSATQQVVAYLKALCAERRVRPADDLVTFVVQAELDGRKLNDEEVNGITFLLFIAGLDTVASSLGWQMRYLAEHPVDQQRLRDDPQLIPEAMDEMMRAFSTVSASRWCMRDTEIGGVLIRAGDLVTPSTICANLDPDEFEDPQVVDFSRSPNRHTAFSYGPHRCLGSHLARREMIITHQEWGRLVPPYRARAGMELTTHGGGVIGLNSLPLIWS